WARALRGTLALRLRPLTATATATAGELVDQLGAGQHSVALDAGLGGQLVQLGDVLGLEFGFRHRGGQAIQPSRHDALPATAAASVPASASAAGQASASRLTWRRDQ